jgi:hypothetical protein
MKGNGRKRGPYAKGVCAAVYAQPANVDRKPAQPQDPWRDRCPVPQDDDEGVRDGEQRGNYQETRRGRLSSSSAETGQDVSSRDSMGSNGKQPALEHTLPSSLTLSRPVVDALAHGDFIFFL